MQNRAINKGFSKLKVTDAVRKQNKALIHFKKVQSKMLALHDPEKLYDQTFCKSLQTNIALQPPLNFAIHVTLRSLAVIPTTEKTDPDLRNDYPSCMQTEVRTVWDLTEHWVTYL